MVYTFFDKISPGRGIKNENISNKELAERLHKPVTKKFIKRKVHSPLIGNIWGPDLADMQLISKFNKWIHFLLFFIDIFSKHTWVIPSKDKKVITTTNAFQKIFHEPNRKPKKGWTDEGRKWNEIMARKNAIKMYSTYSDGTVVAKDLLEP